MAFGSATQRGGRTQTQSRQRQASNNANFSRGLRGSIVEENGELQVLCEHGEACVILTSKSEKNPNRQFHKCARASTEEQCKTFLWEDEKASAYEKQNAKGSRLVGSSQAAPALPQVNGSAATSARTAAAEAAEARAKRAAPEPSSSPARGVFGRSSPPKASQMPIELDGDDEEFPAPNEEELEQIELIENTPPRKKAKFSFNGSPNGTETAMETEDSQATITSSQDASFAQRKTKGPEKQSAWDKIQSDTSSPFHARHEALKSAFTPPASPSHRAGPSSEAGTPTAHNTDEALNLLDGLDAALGGAVVSIATIRKALQGEQRKAKAATQQKDTLLSLKDQQINELRLENASLRAKLDGKHEGAR